MTFTSVNISSTEGLVIYLFMVTHKVFKFQKNLLDFAVGFEIKLKQNMMDRKKHTFIALYFVIRYFSVVFTNIDVISTKKFRHNVKNYNLSETEYRFLKIISNLSSILRSFKNLKILSCCFTFLSIESFWQDISDPNVFVYNFVRKTDYFKLMTMPTELYF